MKKFSLVSLLFIFLLIPVIGVAAPAFTESCTLDAVTTSCTVQLRDETNLGITYHRISWTIKGTNTGSTVLLQYSDDNGISYTTLITGTSTGANSSAVTAGTHPKWKLTLSGFTPTSVGASVTVTHSAYYDNDQATATSDISTVGATALPNCNTTVPCIPVQLFDSNGHAVAYNDVVTIYNSITTTGGATPFKYTATGSSGSKFEIKGSAGTLSTLAVSNTTAAVAYLRCSDQVTASTTVGTTTEIIDLGVPGATTGGGFAVPIPVSGMAFTTGLTCWIVSDAAESGTTDVAANSVKVFATYK